jgi:hypothetical protein
MVLHDTYGNAISMLHTMNDEAFGTGLFVQGVALPGNMKSYAHFLSGAWNDRTKSVPLPNGHQLALITGKDGLPETLASGVGQMHIAIPPLVLLSSGWGRRDVAGMINGPLIWPGPSEYIFGDLFNFVLYTTKDYADDNTCNEFCRMVLPFQSKVVEDLEPWIVPYIQVRSADEIVTLDDVLSVDSSSYVFGMAVLRVQNRNSVDGVTMITSASPYVLNGAAEPVPTSVPPSPSDTPAPSFLMPLVFVLVTWLVTSFAQ